MITNKFETKEEWLEARKGKITGTRAGNLVLKSGKGKKIGFYELIAEKIGIPQEDNENPMDRGSRLEPEAIERFQSETNKKVDTSLILWSRDENEAISLSPDGVISDTEAVEVKCLSSARHIEALLTGELPSEYEDQKLQYFVVNDKLETLYWVFYDPRILKKDFFYFTFNRKDLQKEIFAKLEQETLILSEIEEAVNKLTF